MKIPNYKDVMEKDRKGNLLNPLEQFIRNNQPDGSMDEDDFILDLQKLVDYLLFGHQ